MSDRLRGHLIKLVDGVWHFIDTGESTVETHASRPCGHCKRYDTDDGHDACLGTLAGVRNACYGHGQPEHTYADFEDGRRVEGPAVLLLLRYEDILALESDSNPQVVTND